MKTIPRDRIIELRRIPAKEIDGAPWNWRNHSASQRTAVAASLEELGIYDALIVRVIEGGRYQLIDGHLREDILGAIGPDTVIPCLVTDLDEAEAKLANATHDPLAAMASENKAKRQALLDEISARRSNLLQSIGVRTGGEIVEDQAPAPPDEPITKRGDLWILGAHRLLCGDSSKPEDLDRLLDGAVIHLVNMDPPYNVRVEPRSNNAIAAGITSISRREDLQCDRSTTERGKKDRERKERKRGHHQSFDVARQGEKHATHAKLRAKDRPLVNDFVSDEDFDRLLDAWFGNAARVLAPGRAFYIWGGYANCANYPPFLKKHGLYFSQAIIWDKQHPVLTRKDYMGAHEWCFYGWKEGAGHRFFGPKNATDLWHVKKVNPQSMVHLTEKPVELAARAMEYSSLPGENVLDLFGGSGSTLIAAQQTGRRAFLMELDPLYCDVIVQRFEKFTGTSAERIPANENTPAGAGA